MKRLASAIAVIALMGCATIATAEPSAKDLIADAEKAVKKASNVNGEWRDSAKFIKEAKAALNDGDEGKAKKLAMRAKKEGEMGYEQANSQKNAKPWMF